MAGTDGRRKFMEHFHELVKHYEDMHDEHEYKAHKVSTNVFYENFIKRFDDTFKSVDNPRIKAVLEQLRMKARQLATFSEIKLVHDLAERMVGRLNELGLELYSVPDVEFVLETSRNIEVSVLISCCPEFVHEHACDDDGNESLCCKGTVKRIAFKPGQDIQAAVRLYHEKYCRECERLERVSSHVNGGTRGTG